MTREFLNLPTNIFNGICTYLDNKSLLRLREVSKSTKEVVDDSILITRNTVVEQFRMSRNPKDKVAFCFVYEIPSHYSIWKICLHELSKRPEFQKIVIRTSLAFINVIVPPAIVRNFIGYLKPRIRGSKFDCLSPFDNRNILAICTNFLEGKCINTITIDRSISGNTEVNHWLRLITRHKPIHIDYHQQTQKQDTLYFLAQIATCVKSIRIVVWKNFDSILSTTSIAQEILSKKCEKLEFTDLHSYASISHDEVEKLIQVFHRIDKEISFVSRTNEPQTDVQIGVYRVKTSETRFGRDISIKHLNLI